MENKPNVIRCEFCIKNGKQWGAWKTEVIFQSFEVEDVTIDGKEVKPLWGLEDFDLGYLKAVNWLYQSRLNWSPEQAQFRISPVFVPDFNETTTRVYTLSAREQSDVC